MSTDFNPTRDEAQRLPDITVIISVWNRVDIVGRCLDALERQDTTTVTFETVVVDDGSEDGTDKLLVKYIEKEKLDLRVIRHRINMNLATARNTGLKNARAPTVLFLDADIVTKPDFVEVHANYHRQYPDSNIVILGNCKFPEDWQRTAYDDKTDGSYSHLVNGKNLNPHSELSWWQFRGGLTSAKKSFLLSVGGFNERITRQEDIEIARRLMPMGLKIIYAAEAVGFHYHRRTPREALRICKVEAQILAEMFKSVDSEMQSYVSKYGWYTAGGLKASIKYVISSAFANPFLFPATFRTVDLLMPRFPWLSTQLFRMLRYYIGRNTFNCELKSFRKDAR